MKNIYKILIIIFLVGICLLFYKYGEQKGIEIQKEQMNRYLTYSAINCYPVILNYYGNEVYLGGLHCFENKTWFKYLNG